MTLVDINAEDTHKYSERNRRWSNNYRCNTLSQYSAQHLLNQLGELEIPGLVIGPHLTYIELEFTDTLKKIIDYANENVFQSFKLYLKME